jgi:hypothetical protein
MAETFVPGITITTISTAGTFEKRFLKGDGSLCRAGERAIGVSTNSTDAAGKTIGTMITGVALVEAGGSVTANSEVESDANGKAVTISTGKANGIALNSASAGEDLRVVIR